MPRTLNFPALVFPMDNHTKLMQGFHAGETFLFRVWRVAVTDVAPAAMETAGLDAATSPLVYYLARDAWGNVTPDEPTLYLAGPLTLDGAAAVARSFTDEYNRQTNYGAF